MSLKSTFFYWICATDLSLFFSFPLFFLSVPLPGFQGWTALLTTTLFHQNALPPTNPRDEARQPWAETLLTMSKIIFLSFKLFIQVFLMEKMQTCLFLYPCLSPSLCLFRKFVPLIKQNRPGIYLNNKAQRQSSGSHPLVHKKSFLFQSGKSVRQLSK